MWASRRAPVFVLFVPFRCPKALHFHSGPPRFLYFYALGKGNDSRVPPYVHENAKSRGSPVTGLTSGGAIIDGTHSLEG